jgi:hypothetical protein
MAIHSGTNTNAYILDLDLGQNLTASDNNVRTRATLHYMSPTSSDATVIPSTSNQYSVEVYVPFTVTNSNPYSQLTNNATWFGGSSTGRIVYRFPQSVPTNTGNTIGMSENAAMLEGSALYPNPTASKAILSFGLKNTANVNVTVLNTVGQVVRSYNTNGNVGANEMVIDLSGVASGIYLVNINSGDAVATKKLIVE